MDREELRAYDHRGRVFDQLDKDQNGKVSLDELIAYLLNSKKDQGMIDGFVQHLDRVVQPRLPPPDADLLARTPICNSDFKLPQ